MTKIKSKNLKFSFKIISVVLISLITFSFIEIISFSDTVNSAKLNFKKSYAVIEEKENSIEIACIGNSNLYSGFSPLDLWNEYGYTSTVCASARQTIEESHHFIQQIFKTQNPKLVIIETDMLFDHNPNEENFCEKSYQIQDFLRRTNPILLRQDVMSLVSILNNSEKQKINTHGYRYSSKICKIKYENYMKKTRNSEKITYDNKERMDKLIDLCQANGTKVLLIEMPSISSWNYERHNRVTAYAEEKGIDFIDFNLLYDKLATDPTECYRDKGNHLNYNGAKAVTSYIGKIIKDKYPIENLKPNSKYTDWNDCYRQFTEYKSEFETSHMK